MWNSQSFEKRFSIITYIIIIMLFIIAARLWHLQIIRGKYYANLAQNNIIRIRDIKPIRGNIYDINGRILAFNKPAFALVVDMEDRKKYENLVKKVSQISSMLLLDKKQILKRLNRSIKLGKKRIIVKEGLNIAQVIRIKTFIGNNADIYVDVVPKRFYPMGKLFSHEIGYVGRITQRQLKILGNKGYSGDDWIGQSGIEKNYESELRGKLGRKEIEVDATGNIVKTIREEPAINGTDLILSIDTHIQKIAYNALGDYNGTIVAMNPKDGSIIAMVSKPGFNPNMFIWGFEKREWENLTRKLSHPFNNRAIQSLYPPGSTFKVLMALIVLHTGVISPDGKIFCSGTFSIGKYTWKDWKTGGHGWVNLKDAVVHSCDVYFYNVGHMLGIRTIDKYANLCGFGKKTGIDLPGELSGVLPTPEWKEKVFHQIWFPGDTINLSIGQGFLLVTPIQMAVFISAVANGGYILRPHLLKYFKDNKGRLKPYGRVVLSRLPFRSSEIAFVKQALKEVVERGTGQRCKIKGVSVGAKTGTAQNPHGKDHAWFVAFAPVGNPKIAVSVIVEHGGHGGEVAASISRKIIKEALQR